MSKIQIPTTVPELEEMLGDQKKIDQLIEQKQFPEVIRAYVKAADLAPRSIQDQVDAVLREYGVNRPDLSGGVSTSARASAPGAILNSVWPSLGHYAQAISPQAIQANGIPSALRDIRNDMSSIEPSGGGFLVPEEFAQRLTALTLESAIVRPRATVIPMASSTCLFPTFDETSRASTYFGGVSFTWTEEGAAMTESQPVFGRVRLQASKLTGYCEAPSELVADAFAFSAWLEPALASGIAFEEDYAFLRGNGVGQPLGVLNSAALVTVTKETDQAADSIVWENLCKMYARMLPGSLSRAVWVAHPSCIPELATMSLNVGTGGSAIFLTAGSGSLPMTILGRPLLFSEKLPPVGGSGSGGDVLFADLSYYLIGDRQAVSMQSSPHFKFQNDLICYRIIERVDGRSALLSACTPKSGTDTLSPFVALGER
jgi:HK97 family phage major capsid protein